MKALPYIVIIGGVGTALNVCEQVLDARDRFDYPVKEVFIVIDSFQKGDFINGIKVIGGTDDIPDLVMDNRNKFIFCMHRSDMLEARYNLASGLNIPASSYISFIHPSAYVSPSFGMGKSNIILSNSTIQSDVILGDFNIINSNVTIEHETKLGNANFIAANSCVGSKVKIGNCCFLGLNSSVRENTILGNNVFAGMGSVIINNYSEIRIMGQPAKPY